MKFSLLLFAVIFLFSCQTKPKMVEENAKNQTEIINKDILLGKWTLDYLSPTSGRDISHYKIQKPYLNFVDEVKVAGNNGCNNIAGSYSIKGNVIEFGDKFSSTRMFCEGVDEQAFLNTLKSVNKFDVIDDGKKLVMMTDDMVMISFTKQSDDNLK